MSDVVRIALISDIHANLPALDAVLADIGRRGDADAVYHAGDLVGYSSSPNEVVAPLAERGITGVVGNYDSTVATTTTIAAVARRVRARKSSRT